MRNAKLFIYSIGIILCISLAAVFIFLPQIADVGNNTKNTAKLDNIDKESPYWEEKPENQIAYTADHFIYDINASDNGVIDCYWLNDTANFQIDETNGVVTNATILIVGDYPLMIYVNDTNGNQISEDFIITVEDNTLPTWVEKPTNQNGDCTERFRYDINATDNTAIDNFWINDTTNFQMNSINGTITNNTILLGGVYWFKIGVNDTAGNKIEITISATFSPSVVIIEGNQTIDSGTLQVFTAIAYGLDDSLKYQWYIDGVNKSGNLPLAINYIDGFETGDWSGGSWDADTGWIIESNGNNGTYNALASGDFSNVSLTIMQNFNLTNSTNTELTFWQYAYMTESADSFCVDVSLDNGITWNEENHWQGDVLNDNDYSQITVDLSEYDGESELKIRFRCSLSDTSEGWRIDDIKINATPFRTENKIYLKIYPEVNTTYEIKVKAIDNFFCEEDIIYLKVNHGYFNAIALSLIIDTGGSMAEEISDAINIAKYLVNKLSDHDICALFTFDGNDLPDFVVPMVQMDDDNVFGSSKTGRQYILDSIDSIGAPTGYSPIWDTLWDAIDYTINNDLEGRTGKVILISDGGDTASDTNTYNNDDAEEFPDGDSLGREGLDDGNTQDDFGGIYTGSDFLDGGVCNASIEVYTIGLGITTDEEDKLEEVALTSAGGTYLYAPTSEELNIILS